jgi:hypothetical protein
MIQLHWLKSKSGTWLPFETVNLEAETSFGIYVIWHAGNPSRTVKVGQGNIASRLLSHRRDRSIITYGRIGTMYVTWAAVSPRLVDGVERYLGDYLKPLVAERFPDVAPIAVNSPYA